MKLKINNFNECFVDETNNFLIRPNGDRDENDKDN